MHPTKFSYYVSLAALAFLSACSSTSDRPQPKPVEVTQVLQDVQTAWTTQVGAIDFPLVVGAKAEQVALANAQGQIRVLSSKNGQTQWTFDLKQPIAAGVGFDGQQVAVVTSASELVVVNAGRLLWRVQLASGSFTPPLIAGGRVFVLTNDRKVLAFDGENGHALWSQQRTGDPLVLKSAGVLLPFKNTLIAGLSGRLMGLDPNNGLVYWESAIATPRGTNDVERLVDLIGPADREGDVLCVRAFQSQIGCLNAQTQQMMWTRASVGDRAIDANASMVIAPLSNGVVQAWKIDTGARVWDTERLKYHLLSAPILTPRGVLIADDAGWLYVLSLADGALLNRFKLHGDQLVAAPAQAGDNYIFVTRSGDVTAVRLP